MGEDERTGGSYLEHTPDLHRTGLSGVRRDAPRELVKVCDIQPVSGWVRVKGAPGIGTRAMLICFSEVLLG